MGRIDTPWQAAEKRRRDLKCSPGSAMVVTEGECWLHLLESAALFPTSRHNSALAYVACIARFRRRTKL